MVHFSLEWHRPTEDSINVMVRDPSDKIVHEVRVNWAGLKAELIEITKSFKSLNVTGDERLLHGAERISMGPPAAFLQYRTS